MAQTKGNKAKGRQGAKNKGYYANQKYVTQANKLRRELARKKRFARLAEKRAENPTGRALSRLKKFGKPLIPAA